MREILISDSGASVAFVDDEDYPVLSRIKWHLSSHGYAANSKFYMHSILMGFPSNCVVDHIDRNPLNNQKSNLRLVTVQRNLMNRGRQKNNLTSCRKGVCNVKRQISKPWIASVTKTTDGQKKTYYLGYFATEDEAARAYDAKAFELYGEYAVLNFPR